LSLTSSTTIGHRSRSPSGCGGSFAVTRRCGSPTNRSIVTCICTNENTNRLLRQYLHRNADLATFTQDDLNAIAAKLNHRPRRVLGWATPAEAFGVAEPKPMLRAPA
jgi:hypothetical protein